MAYCVRLLTASEKTVPFRDIMEQVESVRLVSGEDTAWDKFEISQPDATLLAVVERYSRSARDNRVEDEIARLKESLSNCYPENARKWLNDYLSRTRVVYNFRLEAESITPHGWPLLGRVQNLLKDNLGGIIQADSEGYYNEDGDYILWQMYENAAGAIPAAVLDEQGQWVSFQLRLNDRRAVERFKQGLAPEKGFLNRLLGK